jgi:transposase
VLKEPGKNAQSKSYMWVQTTQGSAPDGTGPPIRLFAYSPSRSTAVAQILYKGMHGGTVLMTGGYAVYDQICSANQLVHLACWAHYRRDFNDALQALPKHARGPDQLAAHFIELICKLYAVESRGRDLKLEAEQLLEQLQLHSAPVLKQMEALLLANLQSVLQGSLLGKARHYLSSQWSKFGLYVIHGAYLVDNNSCENSIRSFVIGRRAWLFANTIAGANAGANLYSLLQTCTANGVDGYRYLCALLVTLPRVQTADDYEALLPWSISMPAD